MMAPRSLPNNSSFKNSILTQGNDQVRHEEDRVREYEDKWNEDADNGKVLAEGEPLTIDEAIGGQRIDVFRAEDASADNPNGSSNTMHCEDVQRVIDTSSLIEKQTSGVADDACDSANAHGTANSNKAASWCNSYEADNNPITGSND